MDNQLTPDEQSAAASTSNGVTRPSRQSAGASTKVLTRPSRRTATASTRPSRRTTTVSTRVLTRPSHQTTTTYTRVLFRPLHQSSSEPRRESSATCVQMQPVTAEHQYTLDEGLATAVHEGNVSKARNLLDKGANVNYRDSFNLTPLVTAILHGQRHVVPLLIEWGADVIAKGSSGSTPLHIASALVTGSKFISLLVNAGCPVNETDAKGNTPLHVAASNGNLQVVRHLVKANASLSKRNNFGQTPLDCARSVRRIRCI